MIQNRQMQAVEFPQIIGWMITEGWNPGLADAAAFYATDPGGFFVADAGDGPIAAISVVNHSDTHAHLGLYLCHPDYRGKGIGLALWNHAIKHAGNRTIGLDGVPDQQDNYRKSGFIQSAANQRFSGTIPAAPHQTLAPITDQDIAEVTKREANASGYFKQAFIRLWCRDTETRKTYVTRDADRITGYATIRQCNDGHKIGPFGAETLDQARAILQGLAAKTPDASLIIDLQDSQIRLANLLTDWGLQPAFGTARMYRGPAPTPGPLIHSATTLELG